MQGGRGPGLGRSYSCQARGRQGAHLARMLAGWRATDCAGGRLDCRQCQGCGCKWHAHGARGLTSGMSIPPLRAGRPPAAPHAARAPHTLGAHITAHVTTAATITICARSLSLSLSLSLEHGDIHAHRHATPRLRARPVTCARMRALVRTRSQPRRRPHARTRAHMSGPHTCVCAHTHAPPSAAHMCAYTHTRGHAHARGDIRTHTHTHV